MHRKLKALEHLITVVSQTLDLQTILNDVVESVPKILGGIACSVLLLDETTGQIVLAATSAANLKNSVGQATYKLGEGLTGWVAKYGQPLVVHNVQNKEELARIHPKLQWKGKFKEGQPHRFLAAPIIPEQGSAPIGVIRMPAKQRDRRFTEEDKRLLDAFANGVAGAVRNARLYTAMGRFIDEAAHELSTPLSTIDGFAGSLLRQLRTISRSGNSSRELRSATDSAKLIQGEIGRYQSVVMNLLYNARAERAAIALDKEPINVGQFLKEIVKMAKSRSLAQVKHLRITLSVPRQRLTVLGDKNALTQVLLNLLDNSLKFSPEGSEISVTATKSSSRKILFEVMDQGPGVPQDMRSKIFVKGVAMGNPSVGAKPGLGLGLWIANDIMRRHRSSIKVANQSKDGCKFYFTLPAHNNGG